MSTDPHRIDVHHHVLPPEYVSALATLGIAGGSGIAFPDWNAAVALLPRLERNER